MSYLELEIFSQPLRVNSGGNPDGYGTMKNPRWITAESMRE
jgi:hypothetical protein